MHQEESRAEAGGGNVRVPPSSDGHSHLITKFYTEQFPTAEELVLSFNDSSALEDMQEVVAELRRQVESLTEETKVLSRHTDALKHGGGGGVSAVGAGGVGGRGTTEISATFVDEEGKGGMDDSLASEMSDAYRAGSPDSSSQGSRRGFSSRGGKSKSAQPQEAAAYVLIEDKLMLLEKEGDRLRQLEEKAAKESEEIHDLLIATVEEASRRIRELGLERIKLDREVLDEDLGGASGNLILLYMERRAATQKNYLDKLLGQCQAAEEDIARAQQQLRARRAAGEAFHAIDFEQLRIENQQFNERIEKKNQELVELKGTSTRTVQTLNTLMDALNDMNSEQAQLKKEFKSRCDYLSRCAKEVAGVSQEAGKAESKHHALRAQHEAVKVPRIEEYIAQKAELFELEKACQNWKRKVEIAEGQRGVLRQQVRRLQKQRDAVIAYSENKKKRLQENLERCPTKLPAINQQNNASRARGTSTPKAPAAMSPTPTPSSPSLDPSKPPLVPPKATEEQQAAAPTSAEEKSGAGE